MKYETKYSIGDYVWDSTGMKHKINRVTVTEYLNGGCVYGIDICYGSDIYNRLGTEDVLFSSPEDWLVWKAKQMGVETSDAIVISKKREA